MRRSRNSVISSAFSWRRSLSTLPVPDTALSSSSSLECTYSFDWLRNSFTRRLTLSTEGLLCSVAQDVNRRMNGVARTSKLEPVLEEVNALNSYVEDIPWQNHEAPPPGHDWSTGDTDSADRRMPLPATIEGDVASVVPSGLLTERHAGRPCGTRRSAGQLLDLKYSNAFSRPATSSPRVPRAILHRPHNNPRYWPVVWSWSMDSLESDAGTPQMAHPPFCRSSLPVVPPLWESELTNSSLCGAAILVHKVVVPPEPTQLGHGPLLTLSRILRVPSTSPTLSYSRATRIATVLRVRATTNNRRIAVRAGCAASHLLDLWP